MKNVLKLAVLVLAISMFTGCLGGSDSGPKIFSTTIEGVLRNATGIAAPSLGSPNMSPADTDILEDVKKLNVFIGDLEIGTAEVEVDGTFSIDKSFTYDQLKTIKNWW